MVWSAAANLFQFGVGVVLIALNLRHGLSGLLFIPFLLSECIQMLFLIPGTPWKAPLQVIHARPADVVIALLSANFWMVWNAFEPANVSHIAPAWALMLGTAFYILGFSLSLVSTLYLYPSFSVLPERRKLVTAGPYKIIKHPIYTGYILMALGQSVAGWSLHTWVGLGLSCALYYLRVGREEKVLYESC